MFLCPVLFKKGSSDIQDQMVTCLVSFCSPPGKKFDKYLPQEDYFAKGLYMFDIGQNDLAGAFYSKSFDQIVASIPTILVEFETSLKVR